MLRFLKDTLTKAMGGPVVDVVRQETVWGRASGRREERIDRDGNRYTVFSIAAEGFDGPTEWYNVQCYGTLGDFVHRQVEKGQFLMARGDVRTERWTSKLGQAKHSKVMRAIRLELSDGTNAEDAPPTAKTEAKSADSVQQYLDHTDVAPLRWTTPAFLERNPEWESRAEETLVQREAIRRPDSPWRRDFFGTPQA